MSARTRRWVSERLPQDVETVLRRLARTDDARHIAVMPDVHLAHEVCVGTVLATQRLVYPEAVGGDIGCGMAAVALSGTAELLDRIGDAGPVFDALRRAVPIIRHGAGHGAGTRRDTLPDELDPGLLTGADLRSAAARDGVVELATLGRGNHFLELQADARDDGLWLMVHSGSRAMGQAIRAHHLAGAQRSCVGLGFLEAEAATGRAYLADVAWARRYARASRRAMLAAAAEALGPLLGVGLDEGSWIDCDHNHVQVEPHFGDDLLVHRKGAMAAAAGAAGIVPGSMADPSFHVTGRGVSEALASSAHGAGRVMSRDQARRRISVAQLRRQLDAVRYDPRSLSRIRDEAPAVYKDIRSVMRAQRKLVRVTRTLRPLLTYKGG